MESEHERFWAGTFGDDYAARNTGETWLPSNLALFARIMGTTGQVESVLELGCNVGLNLRAIHALQPAAALTGVDVNARALEQVTGWGKARAVQGSILDPHAGETFALTFTKGVLIHVDPQRLNDAYRRLHDASHRYVLIAEYYNPSPVEVPYRGHSGKLFKRDFAGELLDAYPRLRLVDYGFVYRRDPAFPQDDLTWFLMEKRGA